MNYHKELVIPSDVSCEYLYIQLQTTEYVATC